ncbi:TonB-dependent receptor [Fulvivirga sediminis]|uniref:TonB-dependent receptor n=1 Tax=Fulvivirga sediminis TaxID=2803949 RepID=A0A937F785_9BACT|nr:TonB-dependent receptor [Fulvivirga sediminis]MBL3657722.1 TonB-dependent receptor [Fulvivirga sediminis]
MRFLCFFLLLVCATYGWAQTNSALTGKITDQNNHPLYYVNIYLQDLDKGAYSDSKGAYSIPYVPAGDYEVVFSAVGYKTQTHQVHFTGREPVIIDIALEEDVTELQNVEIIGRKESSYQNSRSFLGTKTEIPLEYLPQAVSYATKELIADQGVMRLGDIVKNFSGVNQNTFYDDIIIRGFRINGSQNTQLLNGMRTSTGFWKQPLVNYLERVEVLKGPASAISGNASPGGVINRVTKKPLDVQRNSVSVSTGSFKNMRVLGDFTGPLNDNKTLLYRLNVGYEDADSYRDLQFDKNIVIAPSISFIPSEKTQFNFDLIYNNSKSRLDRGQSAFKDDLYSTSNSLSLSSANDYLNEESYIMTLSMNHELTDHLSWSASYVRTGYFEDLMEHRSANDYAIDGDGNDIVDQVALRVFKRNRKRFIDNLSTYFTAKASTGPIEHNITWGYDYAQEEVPAGASQLEANGYLSADGNSVLQINNNTDAGKAAFLKNKDAYMLDSEGNPVPNVAHFDLSDPLNSQQMKDESKYIYNKVRSYGPNLYYVHGVYLQDQLTWKKFRALIGLRYDNYTNVLNMDQADEDNVHQDAILPRFGLTYELTKNVNLYGTYVEGYEPQAAANMDPLNGGPFDPLTSHMVEFGAKTNWFNHNLSATLAVYRIDQQNTLYPVPNSDLLQPIGEEVSRGIEVDITGKILPNWSVNAGYAYNKAEITQDAEGNETNIQKPNTPHHQGNLWTRYNFTKGALQNLGVGLGSNFMTDRNLQQNTSQQVPGYTVFDAAVYYKINNCTLQFNLNNLTDKTYWVGGYDYLRLYPGTPRNWLLTFSYNF